MKIWRNLLKDVIYYYNKIFFPFDQEGTTHWGVSAGLIFMVESQKKIRQTERIIDAYLKDPKSAFELYKGHEMDFSGEVVSCVRVLDHNVLFWAVRINVGSIDVIGYLREVIRVGLLVTIRGTCAGLQSNPRIAIVLNPASLCSVTSDVCLD